jgi:hypothetical protein
MGRVWVAMLCAPLLAACSSGSTGATPGGDCTSHYENVVRAPSWAEMKDRLAHHTMPRGRSVRIQGRDGEKRVVDILDRRHRRVIQVEAWRTDDGSWKAGAWAQCIDS